MKILFLTKKSPYFGSEFGGAETSMRLMAEEFTRRGHGVFFVSRNRGRSFLPRVKRDRVDGVEVYTTAFFERFEDISYFYHLQEALMARFLESLVKKHDIEVGYCYYELNNLNLLLNLKQSRPGFKVIMRMAGLHWYEACRENPQLKKVYEDAFNRVDSVNFISAGLQGMVDEKLKELGMNVNFRHRFTGDIGSPLPGKRKDSGGEKNGDGVFRMIMAARFSRHQKRQDLLIEALSLLPSGLPHILHLVGEGPRSEELAALARDRGLEGKVTFEPFCDQGELWAKLRAADLLCHACDYEGLGKIVIESMALGLPVLASKVSPLDEYIRDEENGFLVENDPGAWAKRMEELYKDREKLKRASGQAAAFVEERCSPGKNVLLYEKYFENVRA